MQESLGVDITELQQPLLDGETTGDEAESQVWEFIPLDDSDDSSFKYGTGMANTMLWFTIAKTVAQYNV